MSARIYTLGERRLVTAGDDFYIAPGAPYQSGPVVGSAGVELTPRNSAALGDHMGARG